jgi:formyltetrahydrofolate-dependent phosphoribosylglycinamide formyltransferase
MFERLQKKWKVGGTQLFLIICVFAITGTTTAFLTKQITTWLHLSSSSPWYWLLKIIVLIFGYQVLILIVSIPFGQFPFFWTYEKKILRRFGLMAGNKQSANQTLQKKHLAIFASGTGSNAQKIIDYFKNHVSIKVDLIVSNNPNAGVIKIAAKENIPFLLIEKEKFFRGNGYVDELKERKIDLIVLAGFLWKIPDNLINAYRRRIINIHPALLPRYGGKGYYGQYVHESVIDAKDEESGITIHYVDEHYDHGDIILQVKCPVLQTDTAETLAARIHELEYSFYAKTIEKLLNDNL